MASISITDFLVDKILSFSSKMKESSFKPGSALCLMNDSSNMYSQYAGELLDLFLMNGNLASEYELSKPVQRTNVENPFIKNLGYNNFEQNKVGFSPHLFNVVQDSLRFVLNPPEMLQIPSTGMFSRTLLDSVLSSSCMMEGNSHSKQQSVVQPVNETKLKMSVSVESSSMSERAEIKNNKLNSVNGIKLNLELSNRKTKEMNKRSKKRRRRQKRNKNSYKSTSTPSDVVDSSLASSNSSRIPEKSRDESKIIVSVEHNFQVSPNLVSSFVISVESVSDEDSEWDSSSETDQPELAEFEFTGLLLTNLSTPAPCLHVSPSTVAECNPTSVFQDEDDETARMQAVLVDVNKNWNERNKEIDKKPKSPSKVSFASDDKLAEVFLVEVYDRKGEWEIYACERLRFKRRIEELEKLISPCLSANHRLEVYKKLIKSNL